MSEKMKEAALANAIGVPRTDLEQLRLPKSSTETPPKFRQGEHWVHKGRFIEWTPEGVDAVLEHFAKVMENSPTPPAAPGATETPPAAPSTLDKAADALAAPLPITTPLRRAVLTCTKVYKGNFRIIEAKLEGETDIKIVRMRDNKHFRLGMQFQAVHIHEHRWALSQPPPRFPTDPKFYRKTPSNAQPTNP